MSAKLNKVIIKRLTKKIAKESYFKNNASPICGNELNPPRNKADWFVFEVDLDGDSNEVRVIPSSKSLDLLARVRRKAFSG